MRVAQATDRNTCPLAGRRLLQRHVYLSLILPSIGTGPDVVIFQKLEGGELSDKVLSWRAAIKRVTW